MRAILALALILGALGWVGAHWETGESAWQPPAIAWRRTAHGWEEMSVDPPRTHGPPRAVLDPVTVAALQLLAVLLLAAAHDLRNFRSAPESRTDLTPSGH